MGVTLYLSADYKQKPFLNTGAVGATIGSLEIPDVDMFINYIGDKDAFTSIPFGEIFAINPAVFTNKIILIGASAELVGDIYFTPISRKTPGVVIIANMIHSIYNTPQNLDKGIWCMIACH